MPLERQLFGRQLGDAVADLVRKRWPRDTAKTIAGRWKIDLTTAANVVKGHVSERTISKAISAEGWDFGAPLIEALTGQSYEQHLGRMADEAEAARQRLADRQAQVAALHARLNGE